MKQIPVSVNSECYALRAMKLPSTIQYVKIIYVCIPIYSPPIMTLASLRDQY